jgi:DNA-binding transcriptional LysR family regulator
MGPIGYSDDMSIPPALDPDSLRAFVLIAEGASFTRAAELVGRTQSAVSMQIRKLEETLGQSLFVRPRGGGVDLTAHGRALLDRARELLAAHDAIVHSFRAPAVTGRVRLGSPDDYALRWLPPILASFARSHPAVEVDVLCLPSVELMDDIERGSLDLAIVSGGPYSTRGLAGTELWRGPLCWVTSERHAPHRLDPLPIAVARENCCWREAAIEALERAGRRYRIAYASATQIGTQAPVLAGLAVTPSAIAWLPAGLRPLRADEGLPALPDFSIQLVTARRPPQPVTGALVDHIVASFAAEGGAATGMTRSAA